MPSFSKKHFLFILGLLLISAGTIAQEGSDTWLKFEGTAKEGALRLKDVLVTVYQDTAGVGNWIEIDKKVTKKNGEFEFRARPHSHYLIEVSREGYVTKKVSFDTDTYKDNVNQIEPFKFIVELEPNIDDLNYIKPVANVFYHKRVGQFDYELDYSKEEQDEELKREQERLARLEQQRLEAQRKAEMELAAQQLREEENATIEQKVQAAITLGQEDETATISAFSEIFPTTDTLRQQKAKLMFEKYQQEKAKVGNDKSKINYLALFESAESYEENIEKEKEEKRQKELAEIRKAKELAEKEKEKALEKQMEATQIEMQAKLIEARKREEERKKQEFAEKKSKIQTALKEGAGNEESTVKAIEKTFPRDDPYKEEKARAIYKKYQDLKQAGQNYSNMDYASLFASADEAVEEAKIKEQKEREKEEDKRLAEFMAKVEEKKQEEKAEMIKSIESAIKSSSGGKEETVRKFEAVFDKNDPYKEEKALAMYEEYEANRKLNAESGKNYASVDYESLFAAADEAEEQAKIGERKKKEQRKLEAQKEAQEKMEEKRKAKEEMLKQVEQQALALHSKEENKRELKKMSTTYVELEKAIKDNEGNPEAAVEAIKKVFPENESYKDEKALAILDKYNEQKKQYDLMGQEYTNLDFKSLFAAAEQAEVEALENKYKAQMVEKQQQTKEKYLALEEEKKEEAVKKAETTLAQAEKIEQEAEEKKQVAQAELEKEKREYEKYKQEEELKDLEQQLARAQSEQERIEAEKKKRELNKEKYEQYDQLIASADNALTAQQYKEARGMYTEASDILPEKQYPREKIEEIDSKLAQLQKKKEAEQAKEAKYTGLIADADQAYQKEKFEEAIELYTQASGLKPDEQYPKNQITEINSLIAKAEEQKKLNEQYNTLIDQADQAMKKEQYDQAKEMYANASNVKPNEQCPKNQIREIESILAQLAHEKAEAEQLAAEKEKEQKYNDFIAQADKALGNEEYNVAKELYNSALNVKPDEQYPKNKINEIDQTLAQLAKQREIDEQYSGLITQADRKFEQSQYEAAKSTYAEASQLKPEESYPKDKIAEIDELLTQVAEEKEREKRYNEYIEKGDYALGFEKFEQARDNYEAASKLRPQEEYPQNKLEEIEKLIAEAEKQAKYDELVNRADKLFAVGNYDSAKETYNKALEIKPDEQYPKNRITEIDNLIAQAEEKARQLEEERKRKEAAAKEAKYKDFINKGDDAMNNESYKAAIMFYEDALNVKADEQYPKDQIKEAEKLMAAKRAEAQRLSAIERQKKFEEAMAKAEELEMTEQERRVSFLSEIALIYPEGITEENIQNKDSQLKRYIINDNGNVTILERKTWDWGGVFYFKNGDISITESVFDLQLQNFRDQFENE